MQGEGEGAGGARGGEGCELGRAAGVADEPQPRGVRGDPLGGRPDLAVGDAEQRDLGFGAARIEVVAADLAHVEAGNGGGGGDGTTYASTPDHDDRRQGLVRRAGVGVVPFQFPHERYRSAKKRGHGVLPVRALLVRGDEGRGQLPCRNHIGNRQRHYDRRRAHLRVRMRSMRGTIRVPGRQRNRECRMPALRYGRRRAPVLQLRPQPPAHAEPAAPDGGQARYQP